MGACVRGRCGCMLGGGEGACVRRRVWVHMLGEGVGAYVRGRGWVHMLGGGMVRGRYGCIC